MPRMQRGRARAVVFKPPVPCACHRGRRTSEPIAPWTEGVAVAAGGLGNGGTAGIEKDVAQSASGPLCRDAQRGSARPDHLPERPCQHGARTLRYIGKTWRAQIEPEASKA